MSCAICETRKPRRFCPGVQGEICAPCCGAEREVSVSCPFDCEHLQEARRHERVPELSEQDIPNRDIEVTDRFLEDNDALVALAGRLLLEASLNVPGAVDADLREAFQTLTRTYRTLNSGIYYESRPNNPLAAAIHQGFQERMAQARQELARQTGVSAFRDNDLLGALVFLQRVAVHYDNGRSRGRSFLHFLHGRLPAQTPPPPGGPSLIVP
jgi:hypothetical protein